MIRRALRRWGLVCLPVAFAFSLFATNSPASPDTNTIDPETLDANPAIKQLNDALNKGGVKTEDLLNEQFLFASLLWGSVGGGYLLYARKQREVVPFIGGVTMIAVSCFVTSWFWMSLICIALMAGVYLLVKRGY